MPNKKGPPNFRDAGTGKFVTEEYAVKHPKTTEKEHNKKPAPTSTPAPTKSPPKKRP